MAIGPLNVEFLNLNSQRHFPLTEDSSGLDTSGSLKLPNDFLVGLDLPVSAGLDIDPACFFVMQLGVYATGFTLIVGYQADSGPIPVATALIPAIGFASNSVFTLVGMGDYADTTGKVTVGKLTGFDNQPSGSFTFALANARIEPDCIRPLLQGIAALLISSGGTVSQPMYGDIELVAQENMQLVPVIIAGQDPQIVISAVQGEGLAQPCVCNNNATAQPIVRINGQTGDTNGNFNVLGSACLQVTSQANGLTLDDICSSPCCGCAELATVTAALEQFGSEAASLTNFVNQLQTSVQAMNLIVLGSRLNDNGCSTCS